jgi:hypothetical protein
MVLKFLGIGKKSEFVLEAPPVDSPADSQPAAKAKPAEPAKPAAEPAHAEAIAAPAEKNGKKPGISGKTLKEAKAEKRAKAEKVQPDKKANAEKTEVKAAPPAPKAEPVITNFATTLQPNVTPRRRPGPSMNMFKDMAKQVNPKK